MAKANFKVEVEGPHPFEDEVSRPRAPAAAAAAAAAACDGEVPNTEARASSRNNNDPVLVRMAARAAAANGLGAEDIDELRAQGITVELDTEPAPENAGPPAPVAAGKWIKPTTCRRTAEVGNQKTKGSWKNYAWSRIKEMEEIELFLMAFPVKYVRDVVIPETNKTLYPATDMTEMFRFFGAIFFMACHPGVPDRAMWWSKKEVSEKEGAPFRMNKWFTWDRFNDLMRHITYTDREVPGFEDKFHEVRQMENVFNEHMEEEFDPSWMNTLDESMLAYLNKHCLGWMCVPRKPHPFGNERHTISDGDLVGGNPILWHSELQEGKDRPPELGPKEYNHLGVTVGLMLRMVKAIRRSGKIVTMDSGFCVSKGIVEMERKMGVYGQALIKKRGRYWAKGVPGDLINDYFKDKPIGHSETLELEFDGHPFFVHCCKEERYVTKMMSTHGVLDEVADHEAYRKTSAGEVVRWKYAEPNSRHNRAKHWIDDHNQRRHSPLDLAQLWNTKWWPHRQFSFFLSVAEVNALNSRGRALGKEAESVLYFCKKLAIQLLECNLNEDGELIREADERVTRLRMVRQEHQLTQRPEFTTGTWHHGEWNRSKQRSLVRKYYT
ncbi:hypothetical protein ACHAWF_019026 [Thalassiosira exigua]